MKYLLILTSILLALTTTSATAADYYYCECESGAQTACSAGLDTNDGLSPLTPKKTFANANSTFNSLSAGDSVSFCRGGSFTANAEHQWVNSSCTSANICTVDAYDMPNQQSPQLASPIITQQANLPLFSLADGGSANHEEGYSFSNLDLRCANCTANGGPGFFFYNDIDYVTVDNVSLDGFDIGVHLSGNNGISAGSNGIQEHILLKNLKIKNSKSQGILGGGLDVTISSSSFENNGTNGIFDHHIYVVSSDGIVIKNNDLYRSSLDQNGNCDGVPLVAHGVINNLVIEGNVIHEDLGKANPGCWGIAIDTGYSSAESFTNVVIRGNKIINVGNIGIGVASCDGCIIENNVVFQQQAHGITAISAPDRIRDTADTPLNNVTIRNNSIYMSTGGVGIKLDTEGTNHLVVSNAIHYSGTGAISCFDLDLSAANYTARNNNLCFYPNSTSSEWKAGSGNSTPIGASSFNVDPEFQSPSLPQVNLSSTSAAIVNKGHTTSSSSIDYDGKTRSSQPDIGAFENDGTFAPAQTNAYFK